MTETAAWIQRALPHLAVTEDDVRRICLAAD
jgi:hypothetical protein